MENLFRLVKENPLYGAVIPLSISLHRFERDHQDLAKPRIFVRQYDEDGFTTGFTINRMYGKTLGDKVFSAMEEIEKNARKRILVAFGWLRDPDLRTAIQGMALADGCEGRLYDLIKELDPERSQQIDEMPPLLAREYGEKGIPVAYRLNPRITTVYHEKGELRIGINGLPISDEELRNTNFDEVLRRIISPTKQD